MTLLPEVREQLMDAAFAAPEPPAGGMRASRGGRLALAVSVLVALGVAVVLLTSLHGSSSLGGPATPPPGSSSGGPPQAWVNALAAARQRVGRTEAACSSPLRPRPHHQRFLMTAPPRRITLAVSSLASRPPARQRVTTAELRRLQIDANDIYVRYAWQGHADGIHFYVIPAALVGNTRFLPARCDRELLSDFRGLARRFPVDQRAAAVTYARQRLNPSAMAGVVVSTIGDGVRGQSYEQIPLLDELKTKPTTANGSSGTNASTITSLLVSDRIAAVTATYPVSSYPGRVPKAFSVTKRPQRNLVIFHLAGAFDPPRLTFRSRDHDLDPAALAPSNVSQRATTLPSLVKVFAGNGISPVRFGDSPGQVRTQIDDILGEAGGRYEAQHALCDVDHTIQWPGHPARSPSVLLTAFFRDGRFVGYQDNDSKLDNQRRRLELATLRGLRTGDTLAQGRQLYGRSFKTSDAQGGSWSTSTHTGTLAGYASGIPGRQPAYSIHITTLDAGDVGCPAESP